MARRRPGGPGRGRGTWQTGSMRQSRAPRVIRGAVGASVATFAALVSHTNAGGGMPNWVGIAVPWALALLVCTALAGRSPSLTRLGLGVLVSQLLFHGMFVLGVSTAAGGTPAGVAGHAHHGAILLTGGADPMIAALCADGWMWASHAVAAVVTIAFLHRVEHLARAVSGLWAQARSWAERAVARTRPVAARVSARRMPSIPGSARVAFDAPRLAPLRRRGPPPLPAF